jgi:hypothetical protein
MTKNKPVWVAVPRTADDEDIASARLTERALDYQWGELDLTRKLRAALLWSRIAAPGSGRCGGTRTAATRRRS